MLYNHIKYLSFFVQTLKLVFETVIQVYDFYPFDYFSPLDITT